MACTSNAPIAARFIAAHARFHGLRSTEEIEYVLNGYDIDSEWPPGSHVPYLAYFTLEEFASGRRLADSAAHLWEALVALAPEIHGKHLEFPMQHVAAATEAIFGYHPSCGDGARPWSMASSQAANALAVYSISHAAAASNSWVSGQPCIH